MKPGAFVRLSVLTCLTWQVFWKNSDGRQREGELMPVTEKDGRVLWVLQEDGTVTKLPLINKTIRFLPVYRTCDDRVVVSPPL